MKEKTESALKKPRVDPSGSVHATGSSAGASVEELAEAVAKGEAEARMAAERAEEALVRVLDKRRFSAMQVIGQFNRGFIIASDGADLYIVDQHASDEKARYENLRRMTVLHEQPLVIPARLELTPAEE